MLVRIPVVGAGTTRQHTPPIGVGSVSATVGNPGGNGSYYYWVIATYPIGKVSPLLPGVVINAPAPSVSNTVSVSWGLLTGASSYDVVRTATNQFPGSCSSCLVASANTSGTVVGGVDREMLD